ncbi:3552_t:CDS:2 [Ambispora gerdemannii]|uniref:3552_t:CDS:1 n=1 Tax=Ambispora gerdemannii TaxID=144530 RepID=A0A9N9FYP8_9GLOM|nr:3552_t:CDS:2 [Ambispora gerdemannii]
MEPNTSNANSTSQENNNSNICDNKNEIETSTTSLTPTRTARVIARRVSGKVWKHPKSATRRSQLPRGLSKTWEQRLEERRAQQAVKTLQKELKEEKEAKKQRAREALLKRRKAAEEKERLEKLAAMYSAKKLKRLQKKKEKNFVTIAMSSRKHPSPSSSEVYVSNANKKVRISSASESTLDNAQEQHLPFTAFPDNILNKQYTLPDYVTNFRTAFRNRHDFYDTETTSKVYSHPFPIAVLPRLFSDSFLEKVKQELVTEDFTYRSNDLYEFYQSNSLEGVEKTYLSQLTRVIYSEWFVRLIGGLTGVEVDGETIDLSAHIYKQGSYLLWKKNGHIDMRKLMNDGRSGRRIAFIIYLVDENWGKDDGGTLDLFDIDSQGHPNKVKRSIIPEWNSMAFFEVSPTSYHQVSEVLTPTKPRISISGWFHGSLKSRLSIAEYRMVDELSREEESFDIAEFINEEYWSDEALDNLLKMIHLNGSVELRGFLKEEVYVRLLESLAKDAEWDENPIGPPFSKAPLPAPFHARVEKFFQSSAFRIYLENLTHLKFGAVSSEMRQFRRGNYIIAHDQAADHAGVDVIFSCIREKWDEEWDGATIYYAEHKELPVHVLWPMRNTLTVTERIDGIHKFVKYINCKADSPRTEMAFIWISEHVDDEFDENEELEQVLNEEEEEGNWDDSNGEDKEGENYDILDEKD